MFKVADMELKMTIPKEMREEIEANSNQLRSAIQNHQLIVTKLKAYPENQELRKRAREAEDEIVNIGLEQKTILARLRKDFKDFQRSVKTSTAKNGVEEKRANLSASFNRARKQNITVNRSASGAVTPVSASDDSECSSRPASPPEQIDPEKSEKFPLSIYELSKNEFLGMYSLATHELYREMQNKRAERKRRSTANPQFLYQRGWDFSAKRTKKNTAANISPPHTRQASKKNKTERNSPPKKNSTSPPSPVENVPPLPAIPNLPSGLTIERIPPGTRCATDKPCVECHLAGALLICNVCGGNFHISCHNRPLPDSPSQCPKCMSGKQTRTIGSLTVPSGMSVSYITAKLADKVQERDALLEKNKSLNAELVQLQDRHSQLTISLKSEQVEREELLVTQQSTEAKIQKILDFISSVKDEVLPVSP